VEVLAAVSCADVVTSGMTLLEYKRSLALDHMYGARYHQAIDALNGKQMGGRTLTVNEARPREDRAGRGGSGAPARRDRY